MPAEIGADFGEIHAPYPDADLVITAPGEESGTFDSFVELVIADVAEAREQDETTRPDYQTSGDDNVIIENIAGSPSSLGWVGFAFADRERRHGQVCSRSTAATGAWRPRRRRSPVGEYPISRPLFIYVNADEAEARPELAAFVDFYLSDEGIDCGHRGRLRRARRDCPGGDPRGLGRPLTELLRHHWTGRAFPVRSGVRFRVQLP